MAGTFCKESTISHYGHPSSNLGFFYCKVPLLPLLSCLTLALSLLTSTRIIIAEKNMKYKTIIPKDAAGYHGGEKYLHQGIFFKFALDKQLGENGSRWLFGGDTRNDEKAMKSACNELKVPILFHQFFLTCAGSFQLLSVPNNVTNQKKENFEVSLHGLDPLPVSPTSLSSHLASLARQPLLPLVTLTLASSFQP
jgi:hypothetical protein